MQVSLNSTRREGVALLLVFFMVTGIFSIVAAASLFSNARSRANVDSQNEIQAFYLAAAGLEAAKWEIAADQDPDSDGIGTKTTATSFGTYTVTAEDLGGGSYRLSASGTVGSLEIDIQETVGIGAQQVTTTFTSSAVTIVGAFPSSGLQIKQGVYGSSGSRTFLLDGGSTPALTFSDEDTFNAVGQLFADAINDGDLVAGNITGTPTNEWSGVEIPVIYDSEAAGFLDDLDDLYAELTDEINNTVVPGATSESVGNKTLGSSGSPGTYYFPNDETLQNSDIFNGYGTLVIEKSLLIQSGTTMNWTGDVIVFGGEDTDSSLTVEGALNVTGNLMIVGQADRNSFMTVKNTGTVDVEGTMSSMTSQASGSQLQFLSQGAVTIDGILSVLGPNIQTEFKDTSDTYVEGMFQIGAPSNSLDFLLKFEGDVEFHQQESGVQKGLESYKDLGSDLEISAIDVLVSSGRNVTSFAWVLEE